MLAEPAAVWPWPIVTYFHHVGRALDHYTSMSTDRFQQVLDLFDDVVDLADQLPGEPDRPPFALTFDDGYAETLDTVLPLLEQRGMTATFFVVPAWFGQQVHHDWANQSTRYATAAELRDAQQRGFGIASHCWSHRPLTELDDEDVRAEVEQAAAALAGAELGATLDGVLAYPYGLVPSAVPPTVHRGFSTVKAAADCWLCAPTAIRRVYFDPDDTSDWTTHRDHWTDTWLRSRDHGDCPHRRPR